MNEKITYTLSDVEVVKLAQTFLPLVVTIIIYAFVKILSITKYAPRYKQCKEVAFFGWMALMCLLVWYVMFFSLALGWTQDPIFKDSSLVVYVLSFSGYVIHKQFSSPETQQDGNLEKALIHDIAENEEDMFRQSEMVAEMERALDLYSTQKKSVEK